MAKTLENPFLNYEPPHLDEILMPVHKIDILNLEIGLIMRSVKRKLIEETRLKELLNGVPFKYDYDCERLEPLISFPDSNAELTFVSNAVAGGVQRAIQELIKQDEDFTVPITVEGCFKKDLPRVAQLIVAANMPE